MEKIKTGVVGAFGNNLELYRNRSTGVGLNVNLNQ